MDYFKKFGNYYEKKMITGNQLKFVIVNTEEMYKDILKSEVVVKEVALSKEYGTDIHSLANSYLAVVDSHRKYAFFLPKDKALLKDALRHLTIFIKKGENNYVLFENYWIYEFDSIIRNHFDLNELELIKIHKYRLSKLYYSKKIDKYLLIDCDRIDLKSNIIKPGNTGIFNTLEDVKKARFYEDS
jgi:hypothetical protein